MNNLPALRGTKVPFIRCQRHKNGKVVTVYFTGRKFFLGVPIRRFIMKSSDIIELADNIGKSFIIDGSDESWSIFVDDLGNGQFLVTLLLREDYSEKRDIVDGVEELGKLVADIIYYNELE